MINSAHVRDLIALALREDLAFGDITTTLALPDTKRGVGRIVARESLVVCGLPLLSLVAQQANTNLRVSSRAKEGQLVRAGHVIAELRGDLAALLALERTALNFLQRLCGIATGVRRLVQKVPHLQLLDTRKTTPGWRVLEKYAVMVGGARNHRMHLGDMILVKNNHIDACNGDLAAVLRRIYRGKPPYMPVEVEVRNLMELKAALKFQPEIVMLDNMSDAQIEKALDEVRKLARPPLIEVSGGVREARLLQLGRLGVNLVSMGALTNQAQAADLSMKIGRS